MDWQIKAKPKNISGFLSENVSPYFFHYIYFSVSDWWGDSEGLNALRSLSSMQWFFGSHEAREKRPSKEVWSMPFPLEAQIRHSSILLCKSLSLHVLASTHTEYVVRSYCSMYSLLLSGWLVAWRYWWMSLSRLLTDQSGGVEEPSGFCFKYYLTLFTQNIYL